MFTIDLKSTIPIYEQIVSQIKEQIATGLLLAGSPLPSIRLLAKELNISVITTKRAYTELEHLGLIETIAGKGSYVSSNTSLAEEQLQITLEQHLLSAIDIAKQLSFDAKEIQQLITQLWEE
jgi:GntR family transcriptional regulator